jgi:hypothetical protein
MAKIFTMIIVVTGILMFLAVLGIPTSMGYLIGATPSITSTGLIGVILTAIGAIAGAVAVVLGLFGRNISTLPGSALIASGVLLSFLSDFVSIVNFVPAGWEKISVSLLLAPIGLAYCIALWDWTRSLGSD